MKRLLVTLALAVATIAGTARADTFGIATTGSLPSAETPNAAGALALAADWTRPPAAAQQLTSAELVAIWQRAGTAYGIPWPVLGSINKIESNFGRNMGPSSAGAIGWMQFMPATWLRWGTDASGDGVADPWNPEDAIYSAARYLAAAGGRDDIARGVFAYNHAQWYVDEVLALAGSFGQGSGEAVFTVDRVGEQLAQAQADIVAANQALVAATRRARRLGRAEAPYLLRARTAPLLSDQLAAHKQAVLIDVRRQEALAEAARLQRELGRAQQALETARVRSQQAAYTPGAGTVLGAPVASGDYVFPVGGGPGVVFASHTHHDYPAVDIAAPAGSPVYALGNAIVERAWQYPDPRCGIGLTLRTGDGLVWTYCHLAYLDPKVQAGSFLDAGAPVGLVGSSGHASGPHLHLQLQPPTAWPQQQPWFQSFAGSGFTWTDAAPSSAEDGGVAPHPVFAVDPQPSSGKGTVLAFTQ
jgi:murein DD-endopeptidase MepM/ murein hydrolase activator NlpD